LATGPHRPTHNAPVLEERSCHSARKQSSSDWQPCRSDCMHPSPVGRLPYRPGSVQPLGCDGVCRSACISSTSRDGPPSRCARTEPPIGDPCAPPACWCRRSSTQGGDLHRGACPIQHGTRSASPWPPSFDPAVALPIAAPVQSAPTPYLGPSGRPFDAPIPPPFHRRAPPPTSDFGSGRRPPPFFNPAACRPQACTQFTACRSINAGGFSPHLAATSPAAVPCPAATPTRSTPSQSRYEDETLLWRAYEVYRQQQLDLARGSTEAGSQR